MELPAWGDSITVAPGPFGSSTTPDKTVRRKEHDWQKFRLAVQPQVPSYTPADYAVTPEQSLRSQFASTGLQVIVKTKTVELTPESLRPRKVPGKSKVG